MRILVLGSKGMLGHVMLRTLRAHFEGVKGFSRQSGLDATDLIHSREILTRYSFPNVIVNCVGVVKQRPENMKESVAVNSLFPNFLHQICSEFGSHLVHFSTDCVFDGEAGYYTEEDRPNAKDVYGITKSLGEVQVNALTLRTSIIGRERSNYYGLLEWFLCQKGDIPGYTNSVFSGVTTEWLSETVAELIKRGFYSGLYHVASVPISKYDLLETFRKVYKTPVRIIPTAEPMCDRSLNSYKFVRATGIKTPQLPQLVREQYEKNL